jgi:hypothetical protein
MIRNLQESRKLLWLSGLIKRRWCSFTMATLEHRLTGNTTELPVVLI